MMAQAELVSLAERLVQLDRETAEVRSAMLRLLSNGADPNPPPFERPARPGARPGPKPGAAHPAAIRARAEEERIVALLKDRPGMGPGEIAEATGAKGDTTTERLRRLKERGLVAPAQGGGWMAV
jgi:hypothetical protein